MSNAYIAMRNRQQKTVNDFLNQHAFFAFNDGQFKCGLEKLGIAEADAGQRLTALGGTGGYILKEHAKEFKEMLDAADMERQKAIDDPETGREFAFDMFLYELDNHEFCLTDDTEETLDSLGITAEEVNKSPVLAMALRDACQTIRERDNGYFS